MSCGTRVQDFRPGDPDGARLLRSSLLISYSPTETANCWWPHTAPLFGSQPRRPSCVCSGLEPHCRTSRCARPQPTPSPRYCSLTSLLGTANLHLLALPLRYCSWRPLITAGHPVRSSVPVAVLQPLWLRNSTTAPPALLQLRTAARQFISAGPLLISATTETLTTPPTNVYCSEYRFPRAGR
jgi:hypothetical protein